MEDKKQTRRNLILFPLGTVGRDMVYSDHGRRADL